jgi:C_GCAxxG_C_C family probable redox protein
MAKSVEVKEDPSATQPAGGEASADALAIAIGKRAENLFATRQLECSESVLVVLNRALNGGLSEETAIQLGSGLCDGIGGSGCACGALSGGAVALGLFLGRRGPGFANGRQVKSAAAELHDAFRQRFGATCCRVLTKSQKTDTAVLFRQCAARTGWTARAVAAAVLKQRPELAEKADWAYLRRIDSAMSGRLRRLRGTVAGPFRP